MTLAREPFQVAGLLASCLITSSVKNPVRRKVWGHAFPAWLSEHLLCVCGSHYACAQHVVWFVRTEAILDQSGFTEAACRQSRAGVAQNMVRIIAQV